MMHERMRDMLVHRILVSEEAKSEVRDGDATEDDDD